MCDTWAVFLALSKYFFSGKDVSATLEKMARTPMFVISITLLLTALTMEQVDRGHHDKLSVCACTWQVLSKSMIAPVNAADVGAI